MKNFYKVSNTIENGPRMDRKRTVVGPMKDRQWSRISPISHRLWTVIAPMLFVAFGLFGVNESAWGLDPYQTLTDFNGSTTFSGKGKSGTGLQQLSGTTFSATQNRVTFTIGNLNSFDNPCLVYGNIGYPGSNSSTFGWSAETNYDVKVTSVSIGLRGYEAATTLTPAYGQFTSEGTAPGTKVDCKTNSVGGNGASTVSISNNSGLASTATLSMSTTSDRPYTWALFGNVYANNAQFAITTVTYTYKVTHKKFQYGFSAVLGGVNNESYGSATASGGGTVYNEFTETTASKQVTFTATPTNTTTYKFVGWYSDAECTNQVSKENPYTPTLYNSTAGSVNTLTLYAKFDVKGTPVVTCDIEDEYEIGHEPIDLQTLWTREGNGAITYSIVPNSFVASGTNNTGAVEPALSEGRYLSLGQAGTLQLKMVIDADGDEYLARTVTKDITINKYVPTFTWYCDDNTVYYNREIENFCTSDQSTTSITRSSSVENVASLSGTTLSVYNITGTTRVTMTQAENYYWAGHSEYRDITPVNANNHLEFTIDADNKDGIVIGNTSNVSWNTNGYKFGTNSWGVGGKPDDNIVIAFTGIPDKLTFTKKCDKWGLNLPVDGDCLFEVYESATNGNWGNAIWSYNKQEESRDVTDVPQLQPTTRYIKLRYNGTVYGRFNNIHITERQYFRRQGENATLDFATNLKNHVPEVQSFVVEHANAGYQTSVTAPEHYKVSLDNVNFASEVVYSTNATAETGGDKMGTFTVYVKYLADAIGTHNANVTVHNNLRTDFTVPVTGTTKDKIATQIEYCGASSYSVDAANIASTTLFRVRDTDNDTIVTGVGISLSCEENEQFSIAGGNALDPECGGTNNVKPSFAGNDTYAAATNNNANFAITIARLADEISFENGKAVLVTGDEFDLEGWASALSGTDITYTTASTTVISVEDGKVKAIGKGTATLTATSAGDCTYNSGIAKLTIKVRNASDPCETALLYKSSKHNINLYSGTQTYTIKEGPQDKLTFKVWKTSSVATYSADVKILDNTDNVLHTYTYSVGDLSTTEPETPNVEIDITQYPTARKISISGSGTLYKYISELRVSQKAYLTASTSSVTMSTVKACETATGQFNISYSDLSTLHLTQTNENFSYEVWNGETKLDGFDNDCGDYGTYTVKFFYTPQVVGPYSNEVTISASGKSQTIVLNGTANKPDRTIVWDILSGNVISATQSVDLAAYAETSCLSPAGGVYYTYSSATEGAATIDGSKITFHKAATVTVTAHTTSSELYNDAPTVDKVWTVSKVGIVMETKPTITSTITCGNLSTAVTYDPNDFKAVSALDNTVVIPGTIAYALPASFDHAGLTNITFNFTPTDLSVYEAIQFTVPITVQHIASNATPSVEAITYGEAISSSTPTNSGTTAGTWTWNTENNDAVLDAGEHTLNVHFTPENSNYSELDATVTLKVNKATTSLNWTNAPEDLAYNATGVTYTASSASDGAITYSIIAGGAYASIDDDGVLTIIEPGHQITIQASQVASTNYNAASPITVDVTIAAAPSAPTFNNVAGDNDWQNADNWSNGEVPSGENPDVIISGELIINEDVTVGGLTILPTGSVAVVTNGTLTIKGTSESRSEYGNLFVANGGEVDVNGTLHVGDLTVEASIGTENGSAESGQIAQAEHIAYANAYIEINMVPDGGPMDDSKWYGFTVPFAVNAYTGIAHKEGNNYVNCNYGSDIIIAEYDAIKRLNSGNGWKYISSPTLNPGQFYFFGADGGYNTFRFKASASSYTPSAAASLSVNGSTTNPHANWNGVGNSMLQHATASYAGGSYVQVYKNGLDAYEAVPTGSATFVVGCPFFVQATEATTLVLNVQNEVTAKYYAPSRVDNVEKVACVQLASVDGGYADHVYVSATDKEQNAYMMGHDLSKAGISAIVPQLWVNQYNQQLCVHEAALQGNNAACALGIYAPKSGDYLLSVAQTDNAEIYLTMNGQPIWNLSQSEYLLSLNKGTNDSYGLMMVNAPQVTTGVDEFADDNAQVSKIILNNQLYIIKNGQVFDATGKKVQ